MEPIGLDDATTRLGFDLIFGFYNFLLSVVECLLADFLRLLELRGIRIYDIVNVLESFGVRFVVS